MKSLWTSRTYRDELREPSRATRWPLYGHAGHTYERLRSRKTWRTDEGRCPCDSERPQPVYDNCIATSLLPATVECGSLGRVMVRDFGWEVIAG